MNVQVLKSTWPFPDYEYETCISIAFEYCLDNPENKKKTLILYH